MKLNANDHRRHARRRLPHFVFDYVDGGAENEDCLRRNVDDLAGLHLVPTALRDTRHGDTGIDVFGQRWLAPLGVAPVGFSGLVRPHGDTLLACAAAAAACRMCCRRRRTTGSRRCAKPRCAATPARCSGCSST